MSAKRKYYNEHLVVRTTVPPTCYISVVFTTGHDIKIGRRVPYSRCYVQSHDDGFFIYSLITRSDKRRQGFARRMLRVLVTISNRTGKPLELNVAAGNLAAQSLYKSVGFVSKYDYPEGYSNYRYIYYPKE